ncbi:SDR family NAD(P)-dependent oxidoreductase [Nocardia implantans]|uniref:SDR family NAD(P)-dependent oxidoreductase n=1 Tax=Nocardia implantans TaxID=3108168 RepID=A0ABU6AUG1_9NOCA|nr:MULTISPECIES: SDR family NAD(P)-dependent oxidoreductase [unclassified Nocardia]MBF6192796.1 SDR family NAD(P)-dependent oxidoreductase [Nocardia beijingensis]MEA3530624.1 SDR family NAD(P)-dependent oxidoreductase [Nocardia sp. CDC192]MEB3511001.1 SDR family NAD(P)-dependent oxidoreductase [Nocardia sp. CDC186]
MATLDFSDRVVIVTGAGRGIGRANALLLASRGAAVVVGDLGARIDGSGVEGDDPAAGVVAEITAAGGKAVACNADVSTEQGARALVDAAISSFGKLSAVVNNAGIVRTAPFTEVPDEEYQRHLDVHYFGAMRLCRAAWPHLLEADAPRVVNTISQAMLGNPGMSHYGGSKGALFGLTRNLALEGLAAGIKVNAIAPGAGTRMAEAAADTLSPEIMEYMRTALLPEHVAPVVAYLVHPDCQVTGEVFNVAGGIVNRLALVNTVGIHDPSLTVETVAEQFEQIMAITPQAVPQVVAPAQMPVS